MSELNHCQEIRMYMCTLHFQFKEEEKKNKEKTTRNKVFKVQMLKTFEIFFLF